MSTDQRQTSLDDDMAEARGKKCADGDEAASVEIIAKQTKMYWRAVARCGEVWFCHDLLDERDNAKVVEESARSKRKEEETKREAMHACNVCHGCGARNKHKEPGGYHSYWWVAEIDNAVKQVDWASMFMGGHDFYKEGRQRSPNAHLVPQVCGLFLRKCCTKCYASTVCRLRGLAITTW